MESPERGDRRHKLCQEVLATGIRQPLEGRSDVVVLLFDPVQPCGAVGPTEVGLGFPRIGLEPTRVLLSDDFGVG